MLVYFGSTAKEMKDIFDGKSGGKMEQLLLVAQVIVTILILVFLVRIGKKALNDAMNKSQSNQIPIDKLDIHIPND